MRHVCILILAFCATAATQSIQSPGGLLSLKFSLTGSGVPVYTLQYRQQAVIKPSKLGIMLQKGVALADHFSVSASKITSHDTTWETVWGENRYIRDCYTELYVLLQHINGSRMGLRFRLYDEGLGFRYEFPGQDNLTYFTVTDELTEFSLTGDHTAFWIPGDYDTNEYAYTKSDLSKVDALRGLSASEISSKSVIGSAVVQTPLMLKTAGGLYINIFEAALINYPAMYLAVEKETSKLRSVLAPDAAGNKAYLQTPCVTPWRTVLVSNRAEDIPAQRLVLNLNEPNQLQDVSWIKPQKYVGIWWELHVGRSSWNYADTGNLKLSTTDWNKLRPNGRHGATTARTKTYIDFAAKHGFKGVLVEGWNVGWEDWYGNWKEEVFDFVTPYPDFDVAELNRYAAEKGVKLIMHHETSASVTNYERRMDDAFRYMRSNGYDAVKTGYVGRIIPRGEYHDGQWMVNHYIRVARKAAAFKIMVDAHEPVRPTGLHRTFPNWLTCEAARGNEFNAWSSGNPPEHETILPFTRLLGGPMDYTPGIFQITMDYYAPGKTEQVHTTLAKQLALYVTMYSPLQMAADLPENYERFPDAFRFIKEVPVDWDSTIILSAEPGEYFSAARKERGGRGWFIGCITDTSARQFNIPLNFLDDGMEYLVTEYTDGRKAHWEKNPMDYAIREYRVTSASTLTVHAAPGGGSALSIKPIK